MTGLFKCKRSGQVCCAPKSKILDKQQLQIRNDTNYLKYPLRVISSQQSYAPLTPLTQTPYMPTKVHHYQQMPALNTQSNYNIYPQFGLNELVQLGGISPPPAILTTLTTTSTTTQRPQKYSKYICGVKGTLRNGRNASVLSLVAFKRDRYDVRDEARPMALYAENVNSSDHFVREKLINILFKKNERLLLGSNIVPIQIHQDKLADIVDASGEKHNYYDETQQFIKYGNTQLVNTAMVFATTISDEQLYYNPQTLQKHNSTLLAYHRRARVVGGEDGANGEWCWQVALINSLNQYLCGAALIGTQWALTAAHCVTKLVKLIFLRIDFSYLVKL